MASSALAAISFACPDGGPLCNWKFCSLAAGIIHWSVSLNVSVFWKSFLSKYPLGASVCSLLGYSSCAYLFGLKLAFPSILVTNLSNAAFFCHFSRFSLILSWWKVQLSKVYSDSQAVNALLSGFWMSTKWFSGVFLVILCVWVWNVSPFFRTLA
jgi:hypothetical protein